MKKNKAGLEQKVPEITDLKNQLVRALADYDNLRKRVEKEREEYAKTAGIMLFLKLVPVFELLFQAQKHLKDAGLSFVIAELYKVLADEGIVKVEAESGQIFSEDLHEAVEVISAKDNNVKGKIAEVLDEGWKLTDGPVIKHAKVKVFGEAAADKQSEVINAN